MNTRWIASCPTARRLAHAALAATLLSGLAANAWAHGGEDHGDAALPMVSTTLASRASAETEDFELVAVLTGTTLILTLDRFATNAPVPDAQIELESGSSLKATAKQVAPGIYTVQSELFAKPGKYPLAFSIVAGDTADLLATTLDISAPTADVAHTHSSTEWGLWAAVGAVLLAGIALVGLRRRNSVFRSIGD